MLDNRLEMPRMTNRTGSNDETNELPNDDSNAEPPPENTAAAMRAKKLAAIKAAVEAGEYDSGEVLDEAMKMMRKRIEDDSTSSQ